MPPRRTAEIAVSSVVAVPPTVSRTTRGRSPLPHDERVGLVDHLEPERLGDGALVRVPGRDHHAVRARPRHRRSEQSDRARSEHEDGVVLCELRVADSANRDRHRLGEHADARADLSGERHEVRERHVDPRRESAVAADADQVAPAAAQVELARRAVLARAADHHRRCGVPQLGRPCRSLEERSDELVPRHRPERARQLAVREVQVGAADAARLDRQARPPIGQRPRLAILDHETVRRPHSAFHRPTLPAHLGARRIERVSVR